MRFSRVWQVSRGSCVVLACVVLLLTGCHKRNKKLIAVIPKATANIFWRSVHAGAVKGAWENGVDIVWEGPLTKPISPAKCRLWKP
ncbi:MAG: hypothetical protein ACRD4O_13790 [Bryobacteraceae bacterium]